MKKKCPKCKAVLQIKGLVDSDERVWQKWYYCEDVRCGYDQRGGTAASDRRGSLAGGAPWGTSAAGESPAQDSQ